MGLFTVTTRNSSFQLPPAKLIVGLGNIGENYEKTRHNAGFMAIRAFAEANNASGFSEKNDLRAWVAEYQMEDTKIILALPTTLMNLSGSAVQLLQNYFELGIDQILVVHDDIDLQFGEIKTKVGGGNAGHNGLKSIDNLIGEDYSRIRIGVANEHREKTEASEYVLKQFPKKELEQLPKLFEQTNELITKFIDGSLHE